MTADPTLVEPAPAMFAALTHSLRLTFEALADMYDRRDGPWVDELTDAAVRAVVEGNKTVAISDVQKVAELFSSLRRDLRSQ